jgi:hypothetical protein
VDHRQIGLRRPWIDRVALFVLFPFRFVGKSKIFAAGKLEAIPNKADTRLNRMSSAALVELFADLYYLTWSDPAV